MQGVVDAAAGGHIPIRCCTDNAWPDRPNILCQAPGQAVAADVWGHTWDGAWEVEASVDAGAWFLQSSWPLLLPTACNQPTDSKGSVGKWALATLHSAVRTVWCFAAVGQLDGG